MTKFMRRAAIPLITLIIALGLTTIVLLAAGAPPLTAYEIVALGAFSTEARFGAMLMTAAPLLLCAAGLCITFAGGLYNLGIEGQMAFGAIVAMVPLRLFPELPVALLWPLAFGCGAAGGALWALAVAGLRIYGRVNEIFAGLGLNFLATGVALYLVFGPWRRASGASMAGTDLLPEAIWLPTIGALRLAPSAPIIALIALALVWLLLSRSRWGLEVRAVGLNPLAAERMGVPAVRRTSEALAACGALAGIAGTIQVLAVFHTLIPNISSGIGLLALLVVLLIQYRPAWALPVCVAFAAFSVGSLRLPIALSVDSSLSGVLQGMLVLSALAARAAFAERG